MKAKILVAGLLTCAVLSYSLLNTNSYNMKNINSFLKDQVDYQKTPSIQYAFFDQDSILFEGQYGWSNVKEKKLADSSTTYNLYSVTKTFTALAVLQLAQLGKIELAHPASMYLPEFPYGKDITIEQLLSHTGGIPNPLPLRWIHLANEHELFDRDMFFKEVFKNHSELQSQPGTKFKYSNLGYVLLGQLIERVSGQTFEDYVAENIFKPSGIEPGQLSFQIDAAHHARGYHKWWSIGNAVFGFLIDKEKFMGPREGKWKPFKNFYTNGVAYGGMIGTRYGLMCYVQTLLRDNSPLLNNHYKHILFTERVIDDEPTGMSLSWYTGELKGHTYFSHAGGGGGYYVELRVYPELGVGSVIVYNRSGMTDERILDKADSFFVTEKEAG
jgi:D-alanyl-D-alanine carboxypeptidase